MTDLVAEYRERLGIVDDGEHRWADDDRENTILMSSLVEIKGAEGQLSVYVPREYLATIEGLQDAAGDGIDNLVSLSSLTLEKAITGSEPKASSLCPAFRVHLSEWTEKRSVEMFSATLDYQATGEGRTIHCLVGCSSSKAEFLVKTIMELGVYFGSGATIHHGVPPKSDTAAQFLLPKKTRQWLKHQRRAGRPCIDVKLYAHFNFS